MFNHKIKNNNFAICKFADGLSTNSINQNNIIIKSNIIIKKYNKKKPNPFYESEDDVILWNKKVEQDKLNKINKIDVNYWEYFYDSLYITLIKTLIIIFYDPLIDVVTDVFVIFIYLLAILSITQYYFYNI